MECSLGVGGALRRGVVIAVAAAAVAGGVGCSGSEDMAPYRPRPSADAGPHEDGGQPRDDGGTGMQPPKRPTGVELEEMIAELEPLGLDIEDPDRVCAGWAHACAIDFSGKVHCFPEHADGRSTPPMIEAEVKQVACGLNFSCALDVDGAITCWGAGSDPDVLDVANQSQSVPPEGVFKEIAIGAGGFHACAINDNDVVECWGGGTIDKPATAKGNFRQAVPPEGAFKRIVAGEAHTCAIRDDGEVACWGGGGGECFPPNSYGCGQTTAPMGVFKDLTAGEFHTCGLREDGSATCWGMGLSAAPCAPDSGGVAFDCGQGLIPEEIQAPIKRIRAGNLHTCAITEDYEAVCWGWNSAGQTMPPILYAFSQVTGGDQFSCGWTTGLTLECWGNGPGEIPDPLRFPPED